jgi:mono/diheme cytochrome c family protein
MRKAIALLTVSMLLALGAACGGDDDSGDTGGGSGSVTGDATAGKEVFTSTADPQCTSCHTLADAGATGTVGPNLDDLQPDAATVQSQVESGGGAMPSYEGKLTEQQIADVAAYVSSVAGQ